MLHLSSCWESEQVVSGQEKAGLPACHWLTKRTQLWESRTNIKADQPHLVGTGWQEENDMKKKRNVVLTVWVARYTMESSHSYKDKPQRCPSGKNWLLPWESFKFPLINDWCPILPAWGRSFKCGQMASTGRSEGFEGWGPSRSSYSITDLGWRRRRGKCGFGKTARIIGP